MMVTKLLDCSNPSSGYTDKLAEPMYIMWHGKERCDGNGWEYLVPN